MQTTKEYINKRKKTKTETKRRRRRREKKIMPYILVHLIWCVQQRHKCSIFSFRSNASLLHIWYLFCGFYARNHCDDMNFMANDSFQFAFYSHKSKYSSLCVCSSFVQMQLYTCVSVCELLYSYSDFAWIIFFILASNCVEVDGKWHCAENVWHNIKQTNWKCFWHIYLDELYLFLIVALVLFRLIFVIYHHFYYYCHSFVLAWNN